MKRGLLTGGHNLYGHRIGILMIEGRFPRPPGAIGNASTFPFPVMHHVVKGASGSRTARDLGVLDPASSEFRKAIEPWLEGARYLEDQGCRAITTSCGFAALFQSHLREAVNIPVFASSLMLVPFIAATLRTGRKVGIITAEVASLTRRHLKGASIDPETIHVIGMEGCAEFAATAWEDRRTLDFAAAEAETVEVAKKLVADRKDIGAILLECSLFPPYAAAIQAETRLPVFDFTHLVTLVHSACARTAFSGLL
ncbi:aspartate/glutamate racemase family protein [Mesorhizobium erdmanii]|uniref:aspartate/glutamate racemase family protein n=1 Tax=Mesorhizobium erdmanii TaxID=1777866 RepID=UPI00047EB839|nr:aspartate/glutamate racemase family protein [Mesorhizobium erdmanii]